MQIKKLFQLLVVGGAVLGVAAASYGGSKGEQPAAGTEKKPAPDHPDGGSDRGGGTQGW
jgi:hypothetical protein